MMLITNKVILVLAIGFILPTMVKAKEKLIKSVAFGSCLKQTRPQPVWDSVLLAKPDVFVLLGDNIYGDTRDMEKLKNKWNTFSAISSFQKVRSSSYLLGIWDDHDYGENDAGNEYPRKAESQQIFLDFLGEPKDSDRRKHQAFMIVLPSDPMVNASSLFFWIHVISVPHLNERFKEREEKVHTNQIYQKEPRSLETSNGNGLKRRSMSLQKLESLQAVFKYFRLAMAGKPGAIFPKNENACWHFLRKQIKQAPYFLAETDILQKYQNWRESCPIPF